MTVHGRCLAITQNAFGDPIALVDPPIDGARAEARRL